MRRKAIASVSSKNVILADTDGRMICFVKTFLFNSTSFVILLAKSESKQLKVALVLI